MINYILSVMLGLYIFFGVVFAESSIETIKMPEGFEGVYIGMSLEEFLKIRPNAEEHPMNRHRYNQKVDLSKLNQSLGETITKDILFSVGFYTIRNGKLKNIQLIGAWDMEYTRKHRLNFILSSIKRWGWNFQKRIVKQNPKSKEEYLAPLLLWQMADMMIVAGCTTPEYENKFLKKGAFMITMLVKDEISNFLVGENVNELLLNKLFRDIGVIVVSVDVADIRAGNSTEFKIIDKVKKGDTLVFIESKDDWLKVMLPNGKEGWINKEAVDE